MSRFWYPSSVALWSAAALMVAASAQAQVVASGLQREQPIEISSDKLDVYQPDHKAIFSGNVIAVQGTTKMRAAEMVVFYRGEDQKSPTAKAAATAPVAARRHALTR